MDEINKIIQGDTLTELKKLPDNLVDTIVTSPPYWGLRDYGVPGQIGLEPTLQEYISKLLLITTELKRILKPTGVMFWNHGDCYGGSPTGSMPNPDKNFRSLRTQAAQMECQESLKSVNGDKRKYEKCLMLQNYRLILRMIDGEADWIIGKEGDRKWMAALIDGEGCMFAHKREKGRLNATYGVGIEICNTSKDLIDYAQVLFNGQGSRIDTQRDKNRNRLLFRWRIMSSDAKDLLREIYPFLIAKRRQARALLSMPSSGPEADKIWQYVKACNQGSQNEGHWKEPKIGPQGDQWILRNIIIWDKPNSMPSSVKDRFSCSYEPVFMLVKNKKYFFDLDAVRMPHKIDEGRPPGIVRSREYNYQTKEKKFQKEIRQQKKTTYGKDSGNRARVISSLHQRYEGPHPSGKNPGDLWTIPTQPFPQAHFATFPERLIEPMILAGCPEWICKKCGKARVRIVKTEYIDAGGHGKEKYAENTPDDKTNPGPQGMQYGRANASHKTLGWTDCKCKTGWRSGLVLDPFGGAMTTCVVAKNHRRDYLAIELNPEYIKIGQKRLNNVIRPMF